MVAGTWMVGTYAHLLLPCVTGRKNATECRDVSRYLAAPCSRCPAVMTEVNRIVLATAAVGGDGGER